MEKSSSKPAYVEHLFIEPVETEHSEMYVKAIYLLKESEEIPAKVKSIAKLLNVSAPSVVEMLKRLNALGLVKYTRNGAILTKKGLDVGRRIIRNYRLVEALMAMKFKIPVDERIACGIEHLMTEKFSEALCTLIKHPKKCPHGFSIPLGKCCK
ncbi:MAG: metal-dependent transcriptional regulator [Candidatus Aenigmarchaeota archaeon]|nr:metal-dependent transcriptional regulator [Candidatus Aenigmarchaeota archaeon]